MRCSFSLKVDLKCITPSSGGMYYPNHLQLVGMYTLWHGTCVHKSSLQYFAFICSAGEPPLPIDPQEFVVGDYVRVELDSDIFRLMQEGHGGWNIFMNEVSCCGSTINRFTILL